jgi:predicted RNA-binding Zn ribbon-like protein
MKKEGQLEARGPAFFVADSIGLDFLNSVASPDGQRTEWIGSGTDLLAWLEQAKLVPLKILHSMKEQALPGELDSVAAQARNLREWFRAFVEAHKGRRLEITDIHEVEPLNRLLARDEGFNQLVPYVDGKAASVELHTLRKWRSPETLLIPIAEALARVICEEDFTHVKACEGAACTLMFADRTHRHARRWCSMSVCGNRAKQAAHRAKKAKDREQAKRKTRVGKESRA